MNTRQLADALSDIQTTNPTDRRIVQDSVIALHNFARAQENIEADKPGPGVKLWPLEDQASPMYDDLLASQLSAFPE